MMLRKNFNISTDEMKRVAKDFRVEMEKGLAGKRSSLEMIPTFTGRPTGREIGEFIALDVGGTNFRIIELVLKGGSKTSVPKAMKFVLDKQYLTDRGERLFDFLAASIKRFLIRRKLQTRLNLPLGFTFSFPMEQKGIARGVLLKWTKGFKAEGVIGKDVVKLLEKALESQGIYNIRITALANDTVGTLVARSYSDPDCDIGVIIGTGTNAAYVEKNQGDGMIINTEWGNFDKLKTTPYDRHLDKISDRPGEQIFEKMVSGMYLGELSRIIFNDLIYRSAAFDRPMTFKTDFMSIIERDNSRNLSKVAAILRNFRISNSTLEDRLLVKKVCSLISRRASRLSAAALAGIIMKIDPSLSRSHTVAIDGSLYEKHPHFSKNMKEALKEIFGRRASRIRIALTKDGSGTGAAIIAAVAASKYKGKRG